MNETEQNVIHLPLDQKFEPEIPPGAYLNALLVEHAWAVLQMLTVILPYGAAPDMKDACSYVLKATPRTHGISHRFVGRQSI